MSLRQRLGRIGRWPRLAAVAACLSLAAISALENSAAQPRRAGSRAVVVAARTMPAGHVLTVRDLRTVHTARAGPGAVSRPQRLVGRRLAGPVAREEPVTALRLVDAGLTTGLAPGVVAMPVDVTTDVRGLVAPGGRVDLLAIAADETTSGESGTAAAQRLADRVLVLAALPPDASAADGGCRLVLALDRDDALRIAGARSTRLFQVAALPP